MKVEHRKTLYLVPETQKEMEMWDEALAQYSWASGEFGAIFTESSFREFYSQIKCDASTTKEIKNIACTINAMLVAEAYCDICLEYHSDYYL